MPIHKRLLKLSDYPPIDARRDRLMADAIWAMLQTHSEELVAFYREIWEIDPRKRLLLTSSINIDGVFCSIIDMQQGRGVIPHIPERKPQKSLFQESGRYR